MAIEVTNFNYPTTPNSNRTEVYDWLVANASEYFPGGIEISSSSGRISCHAGSDGTLTIDLPFTESSSSASLGYLEAKYDLEPVSYAPHGEEYNRHSFSRAAKTDKGVVILEERFGRGIFITTTTSGSTCVATLLGNSSSDSGNAHLYLSDLSNKTIYTAWTNAQLTPSILANQFAYLHSAAKTVLVPLVFEGGEHTENLFMVPVSQSQMTYGLEQVTIDGADYVYDGLFALKD